MRGNLTGATHNADLDAPLAQVQLDGTGTATAPQTLEAMSQDGGASAAAFTNNFTYNRLSIGNYTYLRLVDQAHNSAGSGAEAVYADALIQGGSTLDLNGLHVYVRDSQINGAVVGGVVTILPPGGPISLNAPTPAALAAVGQVHDWTFFGRAGQTVSVIANPGSGSPAPLTPNLYYADVRVLDPSSNILASGVSANSGDVVALLGVTLPANGSGACSRGSC